MSDPIFGDVVVKIEDAEKLRFIREQFEEAAGLDLSIASLSKRRQVAVRSGWDLVDEEVKARGLKLDRLARLYEFDIDAGCVVDRGRNFFQARAWTAPEGKKPDAEKA